MKADVPMYYAYWIGYNKKNIHYKIKMSLNANPRK